jgi:hypothetical protein
MKLQKKHGWAVSTTPVTIIESVIFTDDKVSSKFEITLTGEKVTKLFDKKKAEAIIP